LLFPNILFLSIDRENIAINRAAMADYFVLIYLTFNLFIELLNQNRN